MSSKPTGTPSAGSAALQRDTIVAVATPVGRGALSVVRLSGSEVPAIAAAVLDPPPTEVRRAIRCVVRDERGEVIDDVIATLFVAPRSFTGEDVLEISTHGGIVAPVAVVARLIRAGAREATPGEFTRRALLNGKLDLLQAEAIGDLVDARSLAGYRAALRQLDGGLSQRVRTLREQVLELEALLAYDIDFPEEDDGPVSRDRIAAAAQHTLAALTALLATGRQGALVHDGALVVLAGVPNVGKSSLFNALLGEARAIVTDLPGTTRDAIEAVLDLPGYPLRLVDTAGLRQAADPIERLGVATSERYLAQAAIVLACADSPESREAVLAALEGVTPASVLVVATKSDLVTKGDKVDAAVAVSATTGIGLGRLLELIEQRLAAAHGIPAPDAPVLTRARHHAAVARATDELGAFVTAWTLGVLPATVAAIHVRAAADALGELIGAIDVDDVLDAVFRRFCVGK